MLPYQSQQQVASGSVATSACTMQAQHHPADEQSKFGKLTPTHNACIRTGVDKG